MNVGIVKSYDRIGGIGVVTDLLYRQDAYILQSYKNFTTGDLVIYSTKSLKDHVRDSGYYSQYAFDVTLAEKRKFLIEDSFSQGEKGQLTAYHRVLSYFYPEFRGLLIKPLTDPLESFLSEIEVYVQNFDFDKILNGYSIKLRSGGRNKPGGDDTAWVYIESEFLENPNKFDFYTYKLLPVISEQVYYEFGFASYQSLLNSFDSEQANKKAQRLQNQIKSSAKTLYHKDDHIIELVKSLKEEISIISKGFVDKVTKDVESGILVSIFNIRAMRW